MGLGGRKQAGTGTGTGNGAGTGTGTGMHVPCCRRQEARWLLPAPCPLQKALVARQRPDELCCAPGAQTRPRCGLLLRQAVCGPWDLGFKHLAQ